MKNKTKMTRLTALCLVLILMLSALAGCGKTEDSKADTETSKTASGRVLCVGKTTRKHCTEEQARQGGQLSDRGRAVPAPLHRGRQAGDRQQPCRAQHQAFCHRQKKTGCSPRHRRVPKRARQLSASLKQQRKTTSTHMSISSSSSRRRPIWRRMNPWISFCRGTCRMTAALNWHTQLNKIS